ncbi:hypothetical protein GJAV_G00008240 [Gymnothorax javanicus]|nr:hypothetical protein GJAV_G00008240 [Gymnothorax javanicus]
MSSMDCESTGATRVTGVETQSPVIPAPAVPSLEKCVACGTLCSPYRSPQLLPCLHSVCKECIPSVAVGEGKKECPSCDRPYNILDVTDNPILRDSTSEPGVHPLTKCAGCEDSAISGWCVECGEALCSMCVSAHQRVRVTREHTVLPQKMPKGFTPTLFCHVHREEPMKIFCVSCNLLTCRDCQLTCHRNHRYQFLSEAVTAQREEIKALLRRVRQQQGAVKQTLLDMDGRLQDLEELKSNMKAKLQKILISIRVALVQRTADLFKNVQDLYEREAQKIAERKNNLRKLEERREYILSFTEKALQMENQAALLSCKKQVQLQLQDILCQSTAPPASMTDVRLFFEHELYAQIVSFGRVVSNEVPFTRKNLDAATKKSSLPPAPRQNIQPAPSSFQPYSSTLLPPSSSQSPLAPTQTTFTSSQTHPTSVSHPSVYPSQCSVSSQPTAAPCAPSTPVALQSTAGSAVLSSSSVPSYLTHWRARTPPASLISASAPWTQSHKHSGKKRNYTFHPYQPKNYNGPQQPILRLPESPQQQVGAGSPALSFVPVVSESQLLPVPVVPMSSPTLVMFLPSLGSNVTNTGSSVNPPGSGGESQSVGPAESVGHIQPGRDELQSRTQQSVLPIKALADSPCERAPPVGCERSMDLSPATMENEPTSTVTEMDTTSPVGVHQVEGMELPHRSAGCLIKDTDGALTTSTGVRTASGPAGAALAEAGAGTSAVGHLPALPGYSHTSVEVPHEPQQATVGPPAPSCSLENQACHPLSVKQGIRLQSSPPAGFNLPLTVQMAPPPIPLSNQSSDKPSEEPQLQPVQGLYGENKASSSRNTAPKSTVCQHAPPSSAGPIQTPLCHSEKVNDQQPTCSKELLEAHFSDSALAKTKTFGKNPILTKLLLGVPGAEAECVDRVEYRGSPVETEMTKDDGDDIASDFMCKNSFPTSAQVQYSESKASTSGNGAPKPTVCLQTPPSSPGPIQMPLCPSEKFKAQQSTCSMELPEAPSSDSALSKSEVFGKNPLLTELLGGVPSAETECVDRVDYRGSPVETEMSDDNENDEDDVHFDVLCKKEDSGESGGPVSRHCLPMVSVMRLPVNVPPSGHPLPQFRLLPGASDDEILLQMIEDDDQFPSCKSARATRRRPTAPRSKAKVIVLKGPIINPSQPSMSSQRANDCSAQQPPISLGLTSEPEGSSLRRCYKAVKLRCASCRLSGGLTQCAHCGRAFHRDCHIPPISSFSSGEWQCMLCRDLSDVGDLYNEDRGGRPSLSLHDQRKCEHLLLTLMCKKYSAVLYRKVELSSHYIDITLIRGRLLQKLSPPYRTPSEFVSDIWVFLETLSKNSEESDEVFRMQKYFQKKLSKTFGDALHPSLLKCPEREDDDADQDMDEETGKVRETLKRMREFLAATRQTLAKKAATD